MMRSSAFRALAAAGVALLLVAGGASAAVADQIIVDGDGVVPVAGPEGQPAVIGAACSDTSRTFTVLLAARGNGGDQNRFADGALVTLSFTSAEQGMTVAMPDTSLTVDANWHVSTQNRIGTDTVPVQVTLPAKTAEGQGQVSFSYSGQKAGSLTGKVEGNASVTVSWTAGITCISPSDTVAPTLTLPETIIAEATSAAGAVVTFEAKAADETAPAEPLVTCQPASGATFPLGTTTVSCATKDAAGNEGTGTFDVIVQDTTAPVVGTLANVEYEAGGPGTVVTWDDPPATDAVAGAPTTTCAPASGASFPVGQTIVTCSATDGAGNTGSSTFTVTITDTTPPTITVHAPAPTEATGPDGAQVTFTAATAVDLVDGDVEPQCDRASGDVFALGESVVTCVAEDAAGNQSSAQFTVTVRDTTPPEITWTGGPDEGAHYVFGVTIPTPTCTATDLVKGVVACTVDGFSTAVGTHQLTARATDGMNPATSGPRTYTVDPWTKSGFFQPVDMGAVLNTVKAGSTVPLKFELFAGSTALTDVSAVKAFAVKSIACPSALTAADEIEFVTSGQTVLRYDTTAGQFIQNWQTPKSGAGGCYRVTMTAADQVTTVVADFKLK